VTKVYGSNIVVFAEKIMSESLLEASQWDRKKLYLVRQSTHYGNTVLGRYLHTRVTSLNPPVLRVISVAPGAMHEEAARHQLQITANHIPVVK
jgi:hypothetical protein